jgi:hypothetical protein
MRRLYIVLAGDVDSDAIGFAYGHEVEAGLIEDGFRSIDCG